MTPGYKRLDIILLHQKEEVFERILEMLKKEPLTQFSFCEISTNAG
jgi:hypothetical protein